MTLNEADIRPALILETGARRSATATTSKRSRDGFATYDIEIRNDGAEPVQITRVELFDLDLGADRAEAYRQGFRMPSDSARFDLLEAGGEAPFADRKWKFSWLGDTSFQSYGMTAWRAESAPAPLLAGFTSFNDFESYFVYDLSGETIHLKAYCELEDWELAPGESLRMETFMLIEDEDFNVCLEAYASHVATVNDARVPDKTITGWGDWQYYRMEKSEEDILRSLEGLRQARDEGCPLEYVIIDAGYYADAGWFTPNERFPSGLKALSETIREAGFKFGIWFDPYCTESEDSDLSQNHPEWLALNKTTGEPEVGFRAHIIDFSVPETLDWLRATIRRFIDDWGATYIKLDGPRASIYENVAFRQKNVTSVQLIRRTLEVIREECGESVLVEGEGLYGPSIGAVDVQRVQQDNWTWWYQPAPPEARMRGIGLHENLINDLLTSFTHRKFWHNHRENVVLRDAPSPFTHLRQVHPQTIEPLHTENELRSQLTAATMAGGATLLTDPMDQLRRSPRRFDLISKILPNHESGCVPLDAFNGVGQPSVYHKLIERDFETWHAVAVFNWTDAHRDVEIDLTTFASDGEFHLFEFWDQDDLGVASETFTVRDVPPHGCKILSVRKNLNQPQLVGSSAHILQGAVDVSDVRHGEGELTIVIGHHRQIDERLFVWVPDNVGPISVESNARSTLIDDRRSDLLVIHYDGDGETTFTLRWDGTVNNDMKE